MPDLDYLRGQARACRSLAGRTPDDGEAEELRNLALVYEEVAGKLAEREEGARQPRTVG